MSRILAAVIVFALTQLPGFAQTNASKSNPCPRFAAGSTVHNPPSLYSHNGLLTVNLSYNTTTDAKGRTLYCFTTPDGSESPTLYLHPGDKVVVNVKNNVPVGVPASAMQMTTNASDVCGPTTIMDSSSLNVHYHGANISPACHSDNVLQTIINSGESFQYRLQFPLDEPPGLYWYHPHIHGLAEAAVLGGASGAIIVEGLENLQPAVAGLRERVLVIRDQNVAGNPTPGGNIPSWDLTLNYIPISYSALTPAVPAVIHMQPGEKQLWRVVNAAADSLVDLQVVYDGVPQTLQIVALDGVPIGSQDGSRRGSIVGATHIFLATANRAEFIVKGPSSKVSKAIFRTLTVDTGPAGDNDTQRILAKIQLSPTPDNNDIIPAASAKPGLQRFEGLATETPTAHRKLYFSEVISDPSNPLSPTNFYITVDGYTPRLFSASNPPAIVTTQGSVEDWTVENRTAENHEFHIHQIHFLLLAIDGKPVPPEQQQFLDTIQVPYWSGKGPYPSVTVRLDFRGADIGDFVYHCHILGHEDNGMMAIIRVLPISGKSEIVPATGASAVSSSALP
jgi:FtsP/CotA-like multicopper oxidase with cupredoxin domain